MEQEKDWDRRIRILKEKITDVTACLAGDRSSDRWQKINSELQRDKMTITSLNKKAVNTIPEEYRDFHKKSSRDFK